MQAGSNPWMRMSATITGMPAAPALLIAGTTISDSTASTMSTSTASAMSPSITAACCSGVKADTIDSCAPSSTARSFAPRPTIAPNDKPGSQMAKPTRASRRSSPVGRRPLSSASIAGG